MIGGRHGPALDPDKLPFLCQLIHIAPDRVFRDIDQIDQIIVHETGMDTDLLKDQTFSLLLGQSDRDTVGFKFSHSLRAWLQIIINDPIYKDMISGASGFRKFAFFAFFAAQCIAYDILGLNRINWCK
jgi:hypothetical protein